MFQVLIKNEPRELAKHKAYGVVNSCETVDQIDSAYNYIDQYLTMYEDEYNYLELKKVLSDKQSKFQ